MGTGGAPGQRVDAMLGEVRDKFANVEVLSLSNAKTWIDTRYPRMETDAEEWRFQWITDPRDGKVLLFGGIRATIDDDDNIDQFYTNDTWLWDGSAGTWTQIQTANAPRPRQNGAFECRTIARVIASALDAVRLALDNKAVEVSTTVDSHRPDAAYTRMAEGSMGSNGMLAPGARVKRPSTRLATPGASTPSPAAL